MSFGRPSPATLIAVLALFVALGGSSYAALSLRKGSVGATQLKKNAVTSPKVKRGSLLLSDFRASQRSRLRGPEGPPGAQGPEGPQGLAGAPATRLFAAVSDDCSSLRRASGATGVTAAGASRCDVRFDRDVSACVPVASLRAGFALGGEIEAATLTDYPTAAATGLESNEIFVATFNSAGAATRTPFYLTVFC